MGLFACTCVIISLHVNVLVQLWVLAIKYRCLSGKSTSTRASVEWHVKLLSASCPVIDLTVKDAQKMMTSFNIFLQHSILFTPKSAIPLFPQARPQKFLCPFLVCQITNPYWKFCGCTDSVVYPLLSASCLVIDLTISELVCQRVDCEAAGIDYRIGTPTKFSVWIGYLAY